jgi:hypothetical protein
MPDENAKATLTKTRGALAAGIKDMENKRAFIAGSGEMDKHFDQVSNNTSIEANRQMKEKVNEALHADRVMHKGGKVKQDGSHILQKGEAVISKEKVEKHSKEVDALLDGVKEQAADKGEDKKDKKDEKKKKSGSRKYARTEIVHHKNGSHTVTHHPHVMTEGKAAESASYAVPDDNALHSSLKDYIGQEAPEPELTQQPQAQQ